MSAARATAERRLERLERRRPWEAEGRRFDPRPDHHQYGLRVGFVANQEFVDLNRNKAITFTFEIQSMVTLDNGVTTMTVQDYFEKVWLAENGTDAQEGIDLDILHPDLRVRIAGVWLECNKLIINIVTNKRFFLKYLTPDEYSQVRDHRRGITIPLHLSIAGPAQLDDSFVEMPYDELPIAPVLSFQIEQWAPLEQAQGKGPPEQQVGGKVLSSVGRCATHVRQLIGDTSRALRGVCG